MSPTPPSPAPKGAEQRRSSRGRLRLDARRVGLLGLIAAALAVAVYLLFLREDYSVPPGPPEVAGRILFERKKCVRCHKIAGEGGMMGPDLTAVALKHGPAWFAAYLADPKAVEPDTRMPRPRISPAQRDALVAYLETLRGP